jgi:hypothetical protein
MDDIFHSDNKRGFEPMDDYNTTANNSARDFAPGAAAVTSPVSPFQQANNYPPAAAMSPVYGTQSVPMQPYAPQLNDMTFHDVTSPVMNYNDVSMVGAAGGYADDQYHDPHKYQVSHDQHQGQFYSSEPYYDHQQDPHHGGMYYDSQEQPYQYDQQYDQHYDQQYGQQQQHYDQHQQPYYDDGTAAYQQQHIQPPALDETAHHQRPNEHSPTPTAVQQGSPHAPEAMAPVNQRH